MTWWIIAFKRSSARRRGTLRPGLRLRSGPLVLLALLFAPDQPSSLAGGKAPSPLEAAVAEEPPPPPPPPPPPLHSDPDRAHGGNDIWMTRRSKNGAWSVPVNMGSNINTSLSESSAAVSHDGKWLFFSCQHRPDGFGGDDLYVCARQKGGWGPAANLDARNWSRRDSVAVNTVSEEIGACPFPDGRALMFCRRDARQRSYDLLITLRDEDGAWLEAIGFGRPLATPGDERLPTITRDGRELFFTADWGSGMGSYDIWQSYRDDRGNWGEPANLGPLINSPAHEYSPGVSPDGRRLFFAVKKAGEAAYDIYMTERKEGGTWQEAVRLPAPVNSRYEEFCPSVDPDGKTLYFTSDRPSGKIIETDRE